MPIENSVLLDVEKGQALARFEEGSQRVLLMMPEAFTKMLEALKAFGSGGFTIAYLMGEAKGHHDVLTEMEVLRSKGIALAKRAILENIIHRLRVTGWGVAVIQEYEEKRGTLTIVFENDPASAILEPEEKSLLRYYWDGYWVGILSKVLERKASCTEHVDTGGQHTFKISAK